MKTRGWCALLVAVLFLVVAAEPVSKALVTVHVERGRAQLRAAVPSSNRFSKGFFWEYSTRHLSRAGFDDGDLHPFKQWPPEHALADGKWARAEAGKFKGRRCVQLFWSRASYDYWKDRNARLGKGIEVESPWKKRGFRSRKEIWYTFDLLVPPPNDPDGGFPANKRQGICQIFQITDGDGGSWAAMLVVEDNKLLIRHRNPSNEEVVVPNIPRNEWNPVVLHTVASNEQDGAVELWFGGRKVYTATGTNFGWGADFTDEDRLIEEDYQFVKLGHYAFNAGNYDPDDRRTLYYDNITNYSGNPGEMTLRVEAENYRKGGEGRSYHDTTSNNEGGRYRRSEGVDVGVVGDGEDGAYYVGSTKSGEWIDYTVHVPEDGTYDVSFRFASEADRGMARYKVEGKGISPKIDFRSTGGLQEWATVNGSSVGLEAGTYVFRVGVLEGGFRLNWFELVPTTRPPGN